MTINEIIYAVLGGLFGAAITVAFHGFSMQRRRLRRVNDLRPPPAADEFWFKATCLRCKQRNEYQLKDLNSSNLALCSACQTRNVYHGAWAERFK